DDDLSSCQSGVAHRSTDRETATRVDQDSSVIIEQVGWDDPTHDRFFQILLDLCLRDCRIMLRREDHGLDTNRFPIVIFDRYLALAIWTQIADLSRFPRFRQTSRQLV